MLILFEVGSVVEIFSNRTAYVEYGKSHSLIRSWPFVFARIESQKCDVWDRTADRKAVHDERADTR